MTTPYRGHALIGHCHVNLEIVNVDIARWTGTATDLEGVVAASPETVVQLLEQPRPGWSAHAAAIVGPDGAVSVQGTSHFNPVRRAAPTERSLWVRKTPRAT
jgi:hypothetical protein